MTEGNRAHSTAPLSSRIVGSEIAMSSLRHFRHSLSAQDITDTADSLRGILRSVGPEFFWAQLFLMDGQGTITFALTNPEEPDSPSGQALQALETTLLGKSMSDSLRTLCQQFDGQSLVLRQTGSKSKSTETLDRFINYYDVYPIQLEASRQSDILGKRIFSKQAIATFIDTKKHPSMGPWLRNLVITGSCWPASGDLPEMCGIVIFPIISRPGLQAKEPGGLKRTLFRQRHDIPFFSWLILYTAFVFQTYALSQASVDEPLHLRHEISRRGWLKLLIEAAENQKTEVLDERISAVLALESGFVARRVLRSFFEEVGGRIPRLIFSVRERYLQMIRDEVQHNTGGVYPLMIHLKSLYAGLRKTDLDVFQNDHVWPLLQEILHTDSPSSRSLALASTADLVVSSSGELHEQISAAVTTVAGQAISTRAVNMSLIGALFVLALNARELESELRISQVLKEALAIFLSAQSKTSLEEELTYRLYAFASEHTQREILERFRMPQANLEQPADRFQEIQEARRGITYTTGKYEALFKPRDSVPGLKIITVASNKGGVGKSLISLALAAMIADHKKTALVDLDFFGPTLYHLISPASKMEPPGSFINEPLIRSSKFAPDEPLETMREVFSDALWSEDDSGLVLLPSSPFQRDQDRIVPYVVTADGLQVMNYALLRLLMFLQHTGHEFVVFDTPTEIKEVTLCAASLSQTYGGSVVFVSTLYDPAFRPFLLNLPLQFCSIESILLINKLRSLDRQYALDRAAIVDLIGSRHNIGQDSLRIMPEAVIDAAFCVDACFPIGWSEHLDRFLATSHNSQGIQSVIAGLRLHCTDLLPVVSRFVDGQMPVS